MPLWDLMLGREGRTLRNVMHVSMIRYFVEEKINCITGTYETTLHSIDEIVFG
jgi:hypothetical protein